MASFCCHPHGPRFSWATSTMRRQSMLSTSSRPHGWSWDLSRQFIATFSSRSRGVTPKGQFSKGILPKMAETFRLRIYNKLPRIFWLSPLFSGSKDFFSVNLTSWACNKPTRTEWKLISGRAFIWAVIQTLAICCIYGMKSYPVILGLFHRPWVQDP